MTTKIASPAAPKSGHRLVWKIFAFAAAILLGYGVATGIQYALRSGPQDVQALLANITTQRSPQMIAGRLDASVIIGSSRLDNPDQLALPSDSVFTLSLQADQNGMAEVFAINPEGQSNRIWSGRLQAGQSQHTPPLRLQGVRGLEKLRIIFKASQTGGLNPATVIKQVQILHV